MTQPWISEKLLFIFIEIWRKFHLQPGTSSPVQIAETPTNKVMEARFLLKTFIFSDAQLETRNENTNNSCTLDNSKVKATVFEKIVVGKKVIQAFIKLHFQFPIDLVTVFDAILTSRQNVWEITVYENLMWNNFRKTAVLKKNINCGLKLQSKGLY